MNPGDPLQQLHDIVEAQPVSWWPLAPGWWILTIVTIGLIIWALRFLYLRHVRLRWKRQALKELVQLETSYFSSTPDLSTKTGNQEASNLNSELNKFLKRVLSSRNPQHDFRAQKPEDWRATLDAQINVLSEREKDILTHGQYMPKAARLERSAFASLYAWLKGLS